MAGRTYIVFGRSQRPGGETLWNEFGEYVATSSDAAIRQAYAAGLSAESYAATPKRNWAIRTPEVFQPSPVLRLKPVHPDQLSVDDVLADADAALAASKV